ncbi:hypothetical protein E4U41_004985, partial [Claviceps citrina]
RKRQKTGPHTATNNTTAAAAAANSLTKKVIIKTKTTTTLKRDNRLKPPASQLSQEHRLDSPSAASNGKPNGKPNGSKGAPKMSLKIGSPVKKIKPVKPVHGGSPMSKNGRDVDGMSEVSDTMSSPQGK